MYFTPNEEGGFQAGEIHNFDTTISLNAGIKGSFGSNWTYEGFYRHSQNRLVDETPALIDSKAAALYLDPPLGIDPASGYNIYYAPPSRLYTPLTVAQFRSITNLSTDDDQTHTDSLNFSVATTELTHLPADRWALRRLPKWVTTPSRRTSIRCRFPAPTMTSTTPGDRFAQPLWTGRGVQHSDLPHAHRHRGHAVRQLQLRWNELGQGHLQRGSRVSPHPEPAHPRHVRNRLPCAGSLLSIRRTQRLEWRRNRLLPVPAGEEPSTAPTFENCDYNNIYFDAAADGARRSRTRPARR